MKKFGKAAAIAVTAAMLLSTAVGLSACGKGEAFVGEVSAESYATAEEAAKSFLQAEICGDFLTADFVSYKAEKELSQKEIDALKLGDEAEGLQKAEKGTVEYRERAGADVSPAPETDPTQSRAVYLLTYSDSFRYFAPPVEVGETLSASYLKSLQDYTKYSNCTFEMKYADWSDEGGIYSDSEDFTATLQVIENAVYLDMHGKYTQPGYHDNGINTTEINITQYQLKDGSKTRSAEFNVYDDGWDYDEKEEDEEEEKYIHPINFLDTCYAVGYKTIVGTFVKFCARPIMIAFHVVDNTWFAKTENGYAIRTDSAFLQRFSDETDGDVVKELSLEVTVNQDVIVAMNFRYDVCYEGGEDTCNIECKVSDFGKTKFEIPDEVTDLFAKHGMKK